MGHQHMPTVQQKHLEESCWSTSAVHLPPDFMRCRTDTSLILVSPVVRLATSAWVPWLVCWLSPRLRSCQRRSRMWPSPALLPHWCVTLMPLRCWYTQVPMYYPSNAFELNGTVHLNRH
jgi:hypothetical protein